jgi:hypothetical protein
MVLVSKNTQSIFCLYVVEAFKLNWHSLLNRLARPNVLLLLDRD